MTCIIHRDFSRTMKCASRNFPRITRTSFSHMRRTIGRFLEVWNALLEISHELLELDFMTCTIHRDFSRTLFYSSRTFPWITRTWLCSLAVFLEIHRHFSRSVLYSFRILLRIIRTWLFSLAVLLEKSHELLELDHSLPSPTGPPIPRRRPGTDSAPKKSLFESGPENSKFLIHKLAEPPRFPSAWSQVHLEGKSRGRAGQAGRVREELGQHG